MMFIQLTGLSGSGKSTIANGARLLLQQRGHAVEVVDGDIYRNALWPDLGFSRKDRNENIRRLGFVANRFAANGVISIMAAINPYEDVRKELRNYGDHVVTVWINCDLATLLRRDTKQLYHKALLPESHPDRINNLTGVNDPYDVPVDPDLIINTHECTEALSIELLYHFIVNRMVASQQEKVR
ncbi:adenylyl-sulfate kinase [Flavihumibacter petaseus]|uniref:Adenylyl-sulfate kinase n=1 Tax=Flavihumibacter petaseus NBRC 106054 TaxID=1220578 RepID=A0A0E9MWG7_9BACT|nr:adenylyl-sulfate kinase [Flavihumibacter petaseus]GAO41445.1 adenylyl-sulfate kinase [Flavihumibacter petaseus NBRC 106054]